MGGVSSSRLERGCSVVLEREVDVVLCTAHRVCDVMRLPVGGIQ